jgi:hypothetical protein
VPTFRRDPSAADALSRYRNALVGRAPPEELSRLAAPLDPELVETLHWARDVSQQARATPDPLFARRLERDLVQAFSAAAPTAPGPRWTPPRAAPADRAEAAPVTDLARERSLRRPQWEWGQLAAAAALVLVLLGSAGVLRYVTFERPETQLGAVGEPTTETFVDATVTGADETWTPLTVEHWRFQPGENTLSIPALDGPQWIVADGSPVIVTVDGESQSLAPGQSLVVPAGQALTLHNPGLAETSAYRGVANAGFSFEDFDRAVISKETALDTEAHESLPPGPSHIVFDRLTIPSGTLMMAEAATGQDWFDIVAGQLGLTLIGDALPQGWESGRERELTVDESIPILVPGTSVTMRNVGEDPLVLLRLRVSPVTEP